MPMFDLIPFPSNLACLLWSIIFVMLMTRYWQKIACSLRKEKIKQRQFKCFISVQKFLFGLFLYTPIIVKHLSFIPEAKFGPCSY
jgi:K+-transporting ATPase A subunit